MAVTEKPPFTLAAKFDPAEAVPGLAASLTITARRDAGFTEAITLNPPTGLPATVKPPPLKPIAKDQTEVKVPLPLDAKTPLGRVVVSVSGKACERFRKPSPNAIPLTTQ